MAIGGRDIEPGRQHLDRVAGEIRLGDLRQQPRVERARTDKTEAGALAFALEDGEIESDRVSDITLLADEFPELRPDALAKAGASFTRAASMP